MPNGMIEPDHPDLSISQPYKLLSIAAQEEADLPKSA